MDEPSQPDRPPSADPAARVRFDVTWTAGSAHAAAVEPLLARLTDALAPRFGEARIRVIDDAEMAAAHERFKNVPGTTDVLTFDLAGDPNEPLDADVLVCIDEAERQASERGIPVAHELLLYMTHAILHCSGYNDDTEPNAAGMHAREDDLLTAIGIGPVYAASAEHTR